MRLEYLKGSDNKIADTLSHLPPEKLNKEAIAELLDYACASHKPRAEAANINVIEEGKRVDQEVLVWFTQIVKQHKNFRSLLSVEKIRTTLYHPQTNGLAKRVHQTLQRMIGKLDPEKRRKWPAHIGSIIFAYNSTRSLVTGYSPYYLMFGRKPRLPIDLLFPT